MRTPRGRLLGAIIALATLFVARPCEAQEITFVFGRMLGDEISGFGDTVDQLLRRKFEDAPIYGVRVRMGAVPVTLEASVVVSPSGLVVASDPTLDVRTVYAEIDALLSLISGPVTPFITAGVGWHSFRFEFESPVEEASLGYNFGVGIKLGMGEVGLRADFRDHITRFDVEAVDPAVLEILDLRDNQTLHNYELSAGLTISF